MNARAINQVKGNQLTAGKSELNEEQYHIEIYLDMDIATACVNIQASAVN